MPSFFINKAWQRLKKPGRHDCPVPDFFSVCLAVFAYLVAPDSTPNANRIIVEIGGNKPGFRQQFLR